MSGRTTNPFGWNHTPRRKDEDEHVRRANEEYDRIHGPARVVAIPPEQRAPDPTMTRQQVKAARRAVDRFVADLLDTEIKPPWEDL